MSKAGTSSQELNSRVSIVFFFRDFAFQQPLEIAANRIWLGIFLKPINYILCIIVLLKTLQRKLCFKECCCCFTW